jgi:hypothetical protein
MVTSLNLGFGATAGGGVGAALAVAANAAWAAGAPPGWLAGAPLAVPGPPAPGAPAAEAAGACVVAAGVELPLFDEHAAAAAAAIARATIGFVMPSPQNTSK